MQQSGTNRLRTDGDHEIGRRPSFAQERMWFLDRLEGGRSAAYVTTPMWWVRGPLDPAALERALSLLVARHETLRTRFTERDGAAWSLVAESADVRIDWRRATSVAQIDEEARVEAARPFDLSTGPLLKVVVWKLSETTHVLLAAVHHIVSDGWSTGVLVRELAALHDGMALPELPLSYAQYAEEQRRELDGGRLSEDLAYWRERLGGLPALELPTDRPRPVRAGWSGASYGFRLEPELVASLERLGREHGATLYMTLLAVFQVLLGQWSGQRDFGVGTPVAGRSRPEVENLIGLFVNTLVVRAELADDPTFGELLARVRDRTVEALGHQDAPFERVVQELRPDRDLSRSPLFQVMFDLEVRSIAAPRLGAARLHPVEVPFDVTKYDLMFTFTTDPEAAGGFVQYRTDLFDEVSVSRLVRRCRELLAAVVAAPGLRVSELGLPVDEVGLLRRWGAGQVPSGVVGDPVVLFEERARRVPDAVAVWCGGVPVSYGELNARANRVAWWLLERGVGAEVPVGVRLRRGVDMLAVVLGVLKAGGVYVPLDPQWPAERVEFICADVGADVVVEEVPADGREDDPGLPVAEDQLAYVIYTSGSTGRPKGVGVARGQWAAHVGRMRARFGLGPADRVLQFAALAFDASVEQIFPALTCGAALVLPEHGLVAPTQLLADLEQHQVTIANLPPAYFAELVDRLDEQSRSVPDSLRLLILGGDKVRPEDPPRWSKHAPGVPLLNAYGPTEAVVTSTVFDIPADTADVDGGVPVGRAVGERSLYVLDAGLRQVPAGAVGELFIGGTQLARGYVRRAGLTAERFVPDPFASEPGARMYRTGDLVRWRNDGQLAFCGRTDDQVKVRGFRVETGEVEARLREYPGVEDAVVVAWQDRLVAYLTGAAGLATDDVREWLADRLPHYMVPALFVTLDELPRTVGGKTDRSRLPDPDGHRPDLTDDFTAPRTPTEQAIAEVWQEVLQLDRIGVHDDFFHLGGHSLLATRATLRLRTAFGVEIGVRTLFERPTIARLADAVEERLVSEIAAMSAEDVEAALAGQVADDIEQATEEQQA